MRAGAIPGLRLRLHRLVQILHSVRSVEVLLSDFLPILTVSLVKQLELICFVQANHCQEFPLPIELSKVFPCCDAVLWISLEVFLKEKQFVRLMGTHFNSVGV